MYGIKMIQHSDLCPAHCHSRYCRLVDFVDTVCREKETFKDVYVFFYIEPK